MKAYTLEAFKAYMLRQPDFVSSINDSMDGNFDLAFLQDSEGNMADAIADFSWRAWNASQEHTVLKNDCMIGQIWFMKGSPISRLIDYAEGVYKSEAAAQSSKIEFGTDDNEIWWAHDVPFFGTVQMNQTIEHGLTEWDIFFNECWQGPFDTKAQAIQHLEECIKEQQEEMQEQDHD